MTAKLAKLDMMSQPKAFSEFIKAHHTKPCLARKADVAGNKKHSQFSSAREKVCGDKLCFGHIWQPEASCARPVAAQHEKLGENTEKQELEATLKNHRQLGVEKAEESEHKSQLQLWGQEKAATTRQSNMEVKQGQKNELLQRQHPTSQDLPANCTVCL